MKRNKLIVLFLLTSLCSPMVAQVDTATTAFKEQQIEIGANKTFSREQSTASVSIIGNKSIDKRGAKNIGNSIIGQGNGLFSLQNSGFYATTEPTFYVHGLQSISNSSPLILVDGIERDASIVSPEEVDHVIILKDAAALALYGYKGANGAVNIITKRGKYNSHSINVKYDHVFNFMNNRPKFVNAATYANAMNEALANEGAAPKYTADEIGAFQSGKYPTLYPNVNWVDETFRHHGVLNKLDAEFTGGGERFRYYALVNLLSSKGFIKNYNDDLGNNTQDKYVRGNMRANLDMDLTPTTKAKVNLLGILSESSRPGNQADLWDMVYSLPAAAFPVKTDKGDWGGSSTWAGTVNPVAQSSGAAYYKIHERALYADLTLTQNLSALWKGLSATARIGYDTYSTIYEDHSREFLYGYLSPADWNNGIPTPGKYNTGGKNGQMGTGANTSVWKRRFHFDGGFNYEHNFNEDHNLYSQLRYDYEFNDVNGLNTTVYRQNVSWFNQYTYKGRYILGLILAENGSSRLAPGTKWSFSPTVSGAWIMSKEPWMKDIKWIDFLKMRASFGIINADFLPGDDVWNYYKQDYAESGVTYPFNSGYDSPFGQTTLGRLATESPSHERSYKYNLGFDATILGGLDVEADLYYQHRNNIWVDGASGYTAVLGFEAPFVNGGVVRQWGLDLNADYNHTFGDVKINVGGNFSLSKSKIKNQMEEPRLYSNLERTGKPVSQLFGLVADGLFTSQEEIDKSPVQTFSDVRPGDIKYKDINNDNKIDANDVTAIGHNTLCPEIFYGLHLGAEWKGLGFSAMFQGTGRFSAVLNTKSMFWGLVDNTTISQYAYDHRWSPENNDANAIFPRLSSSSNKNNYQTSTYWLRDRSFLKLRNVEVYYNFPKTLLQKTKFINAAKVYVRGVDLLTFDHIDEVDAEQYGINPLTKSIVAGVSLTF